MMSAKYLGYNSNRWYIGYDRVIMDNVLIYSNNIYVIYGDNLDLRLMFANYSIRMQF